MVEIFQSSPKESYVMFVKRIFRYIKGTSDFVLWYPSNKGFQLISYTDVDWVGRVDEKKSTSGNAFFLGECLVMVKYKTIINFTIYSRGRIHWSR